MENERQNRRELRLQSSEYVIVNKRPPLPSVYVSSPYAAAKMPMVSTVAKMKPLKKVLPRLDPMEKLIPPVRTFTIC